MEKYEIAFNYFEGKHHETILGLLTGLTIEEIESVTPRRKIWYSRDYFHAFFKLGFNTNLRFIPFDPETEYPCIIRCRLPDDQYWHGFVYYNDWVYFTNGCMYKFDVFLKTFPSYRVTSMLQVWI